MIDIEFNCYTVSEANCTQHWRNKHKRHRAQQNLVNMMLRGKEKIPLPVTVTLTRTAQRSLDPEDNLPMSLKWIKDAVADWLIPGKAAGRADDNPMIQWLYRQEKGAPMRVRIQIDRHSDIA